MTKAMRRTRRWALGAGVACALGFGAAQALATPARESPPDTCNIRQCRDACQGHGGCVGGMCVCTQPTE
ncbi:MAG TPA: hypothetical protein VF746_03735 [Longimicrobium sp.]|jgi:hypothetical protein